MRNQPSFRSSRTRRWRIALATAGVLALVLAAGVWSAQGSRREEVERLAALLSVRPGMSVAEIGAGSGWLTVRIAERVGAAGRVYSTELDPDRLDEIRQSVREAGLTNVTVVQAGERTTNLPAGCCDAIFMRRVYHHLSDPSAVLSSIGEALKPGGRVAIIEFHPDGLLGMVTGMGIDERAVVAGVTAAGFIQVTTEEWPGLDHYVAVFEKLPAGDRSHGRDRPVTARARTSHAW